MELTKEMWAVMSSRLAKWPRYQVAEVLASIPESGALSVTLDEATAIRQGFLGEVGNNAMQRNINAVLFRRSTPAPEPALCHCYVPDIPHTHEPIPEPAPQQDDADVVDEERIAYREASGGVYPNPEGLKAIHAVARWGMVTLEAVEKAMEEQWMVPAYQNKDAWVAGVLARLTAPKPPSKQERVNDILCKYGATSGNITQTLKCAAEIVAELEAQNGK